MIVDMGAVEDGQQQTVLAKLQDRLKHFGSVTDAKTGDTINIMIDSAAMIGHRSEQKPLKFYRDQLDAEVSMVKARRVVS